MPKKSNAIIALFCVTAAWGLTFPLIRRAVGHISPYEFVVLRLLLSSLIFFPILFLKRKAISFNLMRCAFIFGSLEAGCYLTQTIGLQTIPSSESAFITALSVIIAPFLAPLFGLTKPCWYDYIGSVICLMGIFILTGADLTSLNPGVFWTLACAIFYALGVNYLTRVTGQINDNLSFVGLQLVLGLPFPVLSLAIPHAQSAWNTAAVVAITFCALSTITSYYLQTRFQRRLSVAQVMLIFAFEPVFACIFAFFLNNLQLTRHIYIGGAFVLASFLFSQLLHARADKVAVS